MPLPDKDSFVAHYGGPLRNYAAVVDPTCEEDAPLRNRFVSNVACMTNTAVRAMRSFVGVDGASPNAEPDGFVHDGLWGGAPNVKSTVVRMGEGVWDLTWPLTVQTELGAAPAALGGNFVSTLNFQRALAQVESADGTFKAAHAKVTAANRVRVYGYAGTTLDDLAGLIVTVWVW